MNAPLHFQHEPPSLWGLYGRALRKGNRAAGHPEASKIPELEAHLHGVSTDRARMRAYARLCGFEAPLDYPITWPHILAFPLHLRLLTDPAFPLPLLGLVHLSNTITQHRGLHQGECLDLRCRIANPRTTDKGIEFDLCSEVSSSGSLVWEEVSTTLFRQSNRGQAGKPRHERRPELPRYPKTLSITVPENTGRQYGKVSGDMNPIHLHPVAAKAFGFPRAIAHGMWSKARCVAQLQRRPGWRDGAVEVQTAFKKPLFLPGQVQLNWAEDKDSWPFQLLNAKGNAPHLSGLVRWL